MPVLNRALRRPHVSAVLLVSCLALSCRAYAPTREQGYPGTWVMTLGQRVFIVMTIERQGGQLNLRIQAPSSFSLPAPGGPLRFSHIQRPIQERRSRRTTVGGDGLHVVVDDPAHPGEPDEFDVTLVDPEHASLQLAGVPVAPLPFTRHTGPTPAPATDWDPNRVYAVVEEPATPNAEMATIFDEDQKPRQDSLTAAGDWEAIEKADRVRRERVAALLSANALHAAEDYRKAAFIFQHGDRPNDYLLAHTLALVAMAKGDQGAGWIAAATLDRYLQSMRRPQIYGTQFQGDAAATTQGAYDAQLISDSLRAELGVPARASQAGQLQQMRSPAPGKP